jgi:hypothetical protein
MDLYIYVIQEINTMENGYSSGLYQNPPTLNKKYDEEISTEKSYFEVIKNWNATQKATLINFLWANSLWKTLAEIIPEINYHHNWAFGYGKKKNILKFIVILKRSSGWKPLPYYVIIELLQKYGTAKEFIVPIFNEANIETIERLMKYNFYVRECASYLGCM